MPGPVGSSLVSCGLCMSTWMTRMFPKSPYSTYHTHITTFPHILLIIHLFFLPVMVIGLQLQRNGLLQLHLNKYVHQQLIYSFSPHYYSALYMFSPTLQGHRTLILSCRMTPQPMTLDSWSSTVLAMGTSWLIMPPTRMSFSMLPTASPLVIAPLVCPSSVTSLPPYSFRIIQFCLWIQAHAFIQLGASDHGMDPTLKWSSTTWWTLSCSSGPRRMEDQRSGLIWPLVMLPSESLSFPLLSFLFL